MKSRWVEEEAAQIADEVGLCAYASRLLGAETSLVLAGGGNSSVKTTEHDVFGDPVEVLHVKGSGWDMAGLEPGGMAPLRLATVARLAELPELTDARMAAELKAASLDPSAPAPSVESILHAILPFRFVLHTHADAVLALTNTPDGEARVREAFGDDVVVVPYVMPGFVLAKACAETFPAARHDGTVGMVLLNHGLFTFADDARTAYEQHVALVDRALDRLDQGRLATADAGAADDGTNGHDPLDIGAFGAGDATAFGSGSGAAIVGDPSLEGGDAVDDSGTLGVIAGLRRDISRVAGAPMVVRTATGASIGRLVRRPDLDRVSQVGPATPDHVLRTKRVPLVGRDVAGYARDYQAYVGRNRSRLGDRSVVPVDPAPRVVLDPDLGPCVAAAPRGRHGRHRRDPRPHRLGHRRRRGARRVRDAGRGRHLRRRVLGARAGQAAPPAGAGGADGPRGARDRGGVRHRPGHRRGVPRRRCRRGRTRPRRPVSGGRRPGLPGRAGRCHRCGRGGRAPSASASAPSAGSTRSCVNAGVFPPPAPLGTLDDDVWAPHARRQRRPGRSRCSGRRTRSSVSLRWAAAWSWWPRRTCRPPARVRAPTRRRRRR